MTPAPPRDSDAATSPLGLAPKLAPEHLARLRGRIFGPKRRSIHHYALIELLGKGGFGRVHRAHDPKLKRDVALKEVNFSSPSELLRIEREAQALARLSHPNVVQVYDCGIADDHTYFIAMELVEGPTLATWQGESGRSLSDILTQYLHVARGLLAAHQAGLVHRDFKPTNAAVAPDGRARVLDFGLVKVVHEPPSIESLGVTADELRPAERSSSSSGGEVVGCVAAAAGEVTAEASERCADRSPFARGQDTPREGLGCGAGEPLTVETTQIGFRGTLRYAAPEQFHGRSVDPRADQYSFCVALFEAVFHQHPFVGRSATEIKRTGDGRELSWPDDRSVPTWLKRLLARGLAERPDDRFESMEQLVAELERRLQPPRRWPWALALASLMMGIFVPTLLSSAPVECGDFEEELAGVWDDGVRGQVQQRLAAGPQAKLGSMVLDGFDEYAERWRDERRHACQVQAMASTTATEAQADAEERVECLAGYRDELGRMIQTTQNAALWGTERLVDETLLWQVLPPDPRVCREAAGRVATRSGTSARGSEILDQITEARTALILGDSAAARQATERAVELAGTAGDDALLAQAQYWRGTVASLSAEWSLASESLLRAAVLSQAQGMWLLEIQALARLADNDSDSRLRTGLPASADVAGQSALAVDLALATVERMGASGTVLEAWARSAAGRMHTARGENQQAEAAFRVSAELFELAFGPDNVLVAQQQLQRAGAMGRLPDQGRAARDLAEDAVATMTQWLSDDAPLLAESIFTLGKLERHVGDFDAALSCYRQAEQSMIEPDPRGDLARAELAVEIAEVLYGQGQLDAAAEEIERARGLFLALREPAPAKLHRWSVVAMMIYNTQHEWGRLGEAATVDLGQLDLLRSSDDVAIATSARALFVAQLQLGWHCEALHVLEQRRTALFSSFPEYMTRAINQHAQDFERCRADRGRESDTP